ncbi:MAG: hypothetical protein WCE50_08490 [Candidatus Acidiferrum sp.]
MAEILLKMPKEITAEPTAEWRYSGHVVRVERMESSRRKMGVGVEVQFDCYEDARALLALQFDDSHPECAERHLARSSSS